MHDDDQQQLQNYNNNNNPNELFFWKIKAGINRNYYINVKKDKNEELYLVIKEVKTDMDGNKDVHRVMVFEKDFKKFVFGMKKCLEFVNEERKRNPRPERQYPNSQTHSQNSDYSQNSYNQDNNQNSHSEQNPVQEYDIMADFDLGSEDEQNPNRDSNTFNNPPVNHDQNLDSRNNSDLTDLDDLETFKM